MTEFDKKQIERLKGHQTGIARSCGVSPQYAGLIIDGKRNCKSKKAQEVVKKAKAILEILNN